MSEHRGARQADGSASTKRVHLVGSIPLADTATVFRTATSAIGGYLSRLPDGETGARSRWNSWTAPSYERTVGLELVDPPPGNYTPWRQARLVIEPADLVLARLGFADAALASYVVFSALKRSGEIPSHLRFQVCLPSPVAPMIVLIEEGSRAAVEDAHVRQLTAELEEIFDAIPHDELSVQWDVCQDVGVWEGYYPAYFEDPKRGVVERLAARADVVPADVEVGFHLCYGDFGHKHFMQPRDLGVLTDLASSLGATTQRTIDWIHLPVPIARDDPAYFAPLEKLQLAPETDLYLGVIHLEDGEEGAHRRISAARTVVDEFGIATECGFGRRPPETIGPLLELHAAVAATLP